VLNGNIFATFCAILTTISPLTLEKLHLFGPCGKNRHIPPNISESMGPYHQIFNICRHMYGNY